MSYLMLFLLHVSLFYFHQNHLKIKYMYAYLTCLMQQYQWKYKVNVNNIRIYNNVIIHTQYMYKHVEIENMYKNKSYCFLLFLFCYSDTVLIGVRMVKISCFCGKHPNEGLRSFFLTKHPFLMKDYYCNIHIRIHMRVSIV